MIRHRRSDEYLLITQNDHALLSGRLGALVGNELFSTPNPYAPVIGGMSLHDAGWPLHDDQPTLNREGLPLNFLESPLSIAIPVWNESARLATKRHPYSGLLVSIHVLNLSLGAQQNPQGHDTQERFDLNKFQHRQIELQETLRNSLGLRTDRPLNGGLATPGADPDEDLLLFNYHLLKLMDRLSLEICSGIPLFPQIPEIHPGPGRMPLNLSLTHPEPCRMTVSPWPFGHSRISLEIAARKLPGRAFPNVEEFRAAYAAAPVEELPLFFCST